MKLCDQGNFRGGLIACGAVNHAHGAVEGGTAIQVVGLQPVIIGSGFVKLPVFIDVALLLGTVHGCNHRTHNLRVCQVVGGSAEDVVTTQAGLGLGDPGKGDIIAGRNGGGEGGKFHRHGRVSAAILITA